MKLSAIAGLVASLSVTNAVSAQVVATSMNTQPVVATARPDPDVIVARQPEAPGDGRTFLPSNTEVWLSANQEVTSKRIKEGHKFPLSVSRDVMIGNFVVIPRGTPAEGQISYRTGKGAFGKSAKIEFDLLNITLNGRVIPVGGHYRIEGRGNTGAAVGAVVAVGVFGAFVTGRSAVIAQGSEYRSFTRGETPVMLATGPATPAPAPTAVALQK
jgi:hypothetical protein